MPKIQWEQLVSICDELCDEWAGRKVDEHIFDGAAWGPVEHVVHELAHGVLLGFAVDKNLGHAIGRELGQVSAEISIRHERDA